MRSHPDPGGWSARQEAGCQDYRTKPEQEEPLPFLHPLSLSCICSGGLSQCRVR